MPATVVMSPVAATTRRIQPYRPAPPAGWRSIPVVGRPGLDSENSWTERSGVGGSRGEGTGKRHRPSSQAIGGERAGTAETEMAARGGLEKLGHTLTTARRWTGFRPGARIPTVSVSAITSITLRSSASSPVFGSPVKSAGLAEPSGTSKASRTRPPRMVKPGTHRRRRRPVEPRAWPLKTRKRRPETRSKKILSPGRQIVD